MTWRLPDTYHLAGHGRGTATLKFYEGRDILLPRPAPPAFPQRPPRASSPISTSLLIQIGNTSYFAASDSEPLRIPRTTLQPTLPRLIIFEP